MTTELIFESRRNPVGDYVQVTKRKETGAYAVTIVKMDVPLVTVISREQLQKLAYAIDTFLFDEEMQNENIYSERSEKDCMWERD